MTDNNTTNEEIEPTVLIVEVIEIMNKVGNKWKYRVKDNRFRSFIMQTTIEPRDFPVTLKVGKRYMMPILFSKTMSVGNVDGRYMELIEDSEEGIVSTIPPEEQGGTKEQIDKITAGDIEGFYHASTIDDIHIPLTPSSDKKIELVPKTADDKPLTGKRESQTPQVNDGSQLAVKDEFQYQDHKDEQQILDEVKGRMIDEYVYQFEVDIWKNGKKIGTRTVTGVSYAGIKALVTSRGGYEIKQNTIVQVNDTWYAKVIIHDKIKDLEGLGLGECMIHEKFSRQVAMGKALRNAYRSAMDEAQFKAFALQWLKENKK